jgi:hypothetical protein
MATEIKKAIDIRVRVKPVMGTLIHSSSNEGPCRVGSRELLSPENEKIRGKGSFKQFCESVKVELSEQAEILSPVNIIYGDDFIISEGEFRKIEADAEDVDLYFVAGAGHLNFVCVEIGERYRKPVAILGDSFCAANLRAEGLEGYGLLNYSDLNRLISFLQVRKSIKNTRLLRVLDREITPGVVNTETGLKHIKENFGMTCLNASIKELAEEIDRVKGKESEKITDHLTKNAEKVHMKREYVVRSVNFYLGVKNLMKKYGCNAFTTDCFEICPDGRLASKIKAVPCLAHSLLKDEGIPSSCEGDIGALLTMAVLMYMSGKSIYMGNLGLSSTENVMRFGHNVPGLKMKGFDKLNLPYIIRNFTAGGWGATIHYDFSLDKGQEVTLARFNPLANRVLAIKGEIVGCEGFDKVGCALIALIKVKDSKEVFYRSCDFGRHFTMVYGDVLSQLKELADLMRFEVVTPF